MAFNNVNREKPPIPPKPIHLLKHRLPKPPDFCAEKLGLVFGDLRDHIEENQREKRSELSVHDEDYGYSEAATGSDWDDKTNSPVSNKLKEFPVARVTPQPMTVPVKHKEAPELLEASSVKDVRQRPLPLLPGEKEMSVAGKPWYKLVDRREGEQLVKNGVDGYFLVRPSSKGESCLTLTLWYNGRTYNIPIRRRSDGLFALGTPKDLEQSFKTVEDMVKNYQKEELIIYTNGVEAGRTTLKIYPA